MHDLAGIIHQNSNASLRHHALTIAEALCNTLVTLGPKVREDIVFDLTRVLKNAAGQLPEGDVERIAAERLHDLVFAGKLPAAPEGLGGTTYVPESTYIPSPAN